MVRLRILQILAWPFALLTLVPSFEAVAGDSVVEAKIYSSRAGAYLYFGGFNSEQIYQAHKEVYLDLRFDGGGEFNAAALKMSVNGLAFSGTTQQWKKAAQWSEDTKGQLRFRMGPLKFGSNKKFFRLLEEVHHYHGWLRVYVHSPRQLRSARLVFGQGKLQPPRVYLDSVEPYSQYLRTRDIRFRFHGDDHTSSYECRLNGVHKWRACESPVAYTDLKNRHYAFKVRAIGSDGRHGKAVKWKFEVRAPRPGVKIQKVDPAELVTSRRDITIKYKKLGKHAKYARTYCRIDRGRFYWCDSPVKYEKLSLGNHAVEIRRTHWIYGYSLGRWLGKFDWFRRHVPVHTAPVVYRWMISDSKPQVAWLETPAEETNSATATFRFEGKGTDSFTCTLDNGAPNACKPEVTLENLTEGSHQFTVVGQGGGQSSEPLIFHWKVDQTGPVLSLSSVNPAGAVVGVQELAVSLAVNEPATLVCELDGSSLGACEPSFVLTELSEGPHLLRVVGTDSVGNAGDPLEYGWTVDLTAPDLTVQMTFPETSPTNERRADFSILSNGDSVTCALDGAAPVACGATVSYGDLAEGTHDLDVESVDGAGNGTQASFSWEVDLTAPVVVLGTPVPDEPQTLSTSLELPFTVSEMGSVTCELDLGGQIPCTSPYVVNGLAEGPHKIEVVAGDLAGNTGAATYAWTVKVDAQVQMDSVEPSVSPTAQTSADFGFSSANASGFECQLDSGAAVACSSPQHFASLGDGSHTFQVWGLNSLGERGPVQSHTWVVDTEGPAVAFGQIDPPGDTTESAIRVEFSTEAGATFFCRLDGGAEGECVSPFVQSALGQGNHSFEVAAEDSLGNRGAVAVHNWVVDVPAPPAQIDSVSPPELLTSVTGITFQFSSPGASSTQCRLDGAAFAPCTTSQSYSDLGEGQHVFEVQGLNGFDEAGPVASHTWVVDTTGPVVTLGAIVPAGDTDETDIRVEFSAEPGASFFCRLDAGAEQSCVSPFVQSGLGQGAHSVVVIAEDSLGNRGNGVTHTWNIDVPPPVVAIGAVTPSETVTNQTEIQIAFSGAPTYECRLDGGAFAGCVSPQSYSGLSEGSHAFAVRGLNAFGEAGAEVTHNWTVDTQGPVVLFVAIDPPADTDRTDIAVSFTSEAGASFFCQLDGGGEQPCASPFSATGLGQGNHAFSVVAEDGLGNRGAPLVHTWNVDVPAPTVTLGSISPSGSPVNSSSLNVAFSGTGAASFQCRLDSGTFAACTSPQNFTGLSQGSHLFEVRALNSFGEPSPIQSYSWTVDSVAPVVQIDSVAPAANPTTQTYLDVAFSANETVTFQCDLDGGGFGPCSSPMGLNVAVGDHVFTILGTDAAGNSSQASYSWTVEAPELVVSGEAVRNVQSTSASVEWQTNLPANSQVIYGEGSALNLSTALEGTLTTSHAQPLTGLKPFTVYSAQAISVDQYGREVRSSVLTFRTQF